MKQFRHSLRRSILGGVWFVLLCCCDGAVNAADSAEQEAIAKVKEAGGSIRKIAMSVEWREAAFQLSDKDITNDALKPLGAIDNLVWLYLQGTKITDAGLLHIRGLKQLTKLHLEKTQIGDAGLKHLRDLNNLEYLNLYGTRVTDAGLEHLKGLKKLKKLYLWQSAVSEEGAESLRAALPDAAVVLGAELAKPRVEEATTDGDNKKDTE